MAKNIIAHPVYGELRQVVLPKVGEDERDRAPGINCYLPNHGGEGLGIRGERGFAAAPWTLSGEFRGSLADPEDAP